VLSGEHSYVKDCSFYVRDAGSTNASSVEVDSNLTKVDSCRFESMTTSATAINQTLSTSTNNLWQFNKFTGITETKFNDLSRSIGVRSDYGMVPLGSVIPWLGVSYLNSVNGGPLGLAGSGTALQTYLGDGWVVCNGQTLPSSSPLYSPSYIYAPELTGQRLLRGHTSTGTIGGANTKTLSAANVPQHRHTMSHGHGDTFAISGSPSSGTHNHYMAHVHKWGITTGLLLKTRNNFGVAEAESPNITSYPTHDISALAGSGGGDRLVVRGESDSHYTAAAQRGGSGALTTTNGPSSTTSIGISGSVSTGGSNTGYYGSSSSFSLESNYINTIYIMRVK